MGTGQVRFNEELGAILRSRREARGLALDALSKQLGGAPGPGFLGRLEEGLVAGTTGLILKLAEVLDLPAEALLNAAGFATEAQRATAIVMLRDGAERPRHHGDA